MKKLYFILCLLISFSASAQLIINEILYDPPAGASGDANGDGTRDATDDEFIEFINNSATSLDVSDYKIYDFVIADGTRTLRHTIPSGTVLPANGFLVVFGGGAPTGTFGGATVITDTGSAGLSLNNSGEKIQIDDASGTQILEFDSDALSNNPDESYSRDPDITGAFSQHAGITAASGALFSPGTFLDGTTPSLSLEEFEKPDFTVYPNPVTNGILNIKSTSTSSFNISVMNIIGQEVIKTTLINNVLDVSQLNLGLYIVKITQDNNTISKKIMVK